ncbi:unnamed protein product, partial [Larinioides sclopetarius]
MECENNSSSTSEYFVGLKEKIARISDKLERVTAEIERLRKDKLSAEYKFSENERKLREDATTLEIDS